MDAEDAKGRTPSFIAVERGLEVLITHTHIVIVGTLVAVVLLRISIASPAQDSLRLLVLRGANLEHADREGKTLRMIAEETRHEELFLKVLQVCCHLSLFLPLPTFTRRPPPNPTPNPIAKPDRHVTVCFSSSCVPPSPSDQCPSVCIFAGGHVISPIRADVYCKAKQARQAGEDKKLFETAVKKFNIHPQKGIDFLISSGYGSSPKDIARFLFVAENLKKDKACILLPPAS